MWGVSLEDNEQNSNAARIPYGLQSDRLCRDAKAQFERAMQKWQASQASNPGGTVAQAPAAHNGKCSKRTRTESESALMDKALYKRRAEALTES